MVSRCLRDYLLDCRDLRKLQEESKGPAWETNGLVSPSRPPGSGICATRLDSCLGLEQLPWNSLTKLRACVGAEGRDGGRGRSFHLLRSCPRLCFSAAAPCPPVPARAQADIRPPGAAARPTPLTVVAAAPGEQCDHGHPPQAGTSAERPCPWPQACRLSSLLHTRSPAGTT